MNLQGHGLVKEDINEAKIVRKNDSDVKKKDDLKNLTAVLHPQARSKKMNTNVRKLGAIPSEAQNAKSR